VLQFGHDCAHLRHAADAATFLYDFAASADGRRLKMQHFAQGGMSIRGCFDEEAAAILRTALEPPAKRGGPDDHREREQRQADALVELATHSLDSGVVPRRHGQRPHLQVTATLETLMGLAGAAAGELELAPPIPATTVQRLACDASVVRVLLDQESAVIDVGRARRLPSGATRRALTRRDGGCVWPGCDRSASYTSAHHLRHWAHWGATSMENLVRLCGRHHWRVHEGGWQLTRTDKGVIVLPPVFESMRPRAPTQAAA